MYTIRACIINDNFLVIKINTTIIFLESVSNLNVNGHTCRMFLFVWYRFVSVDCLKKKKTNKRNIINSTDKTRKIEKN